MLRRFTNSSSRAVTTLAALAALSCSSTTLVNNDNAAGSSGAGGVGGQGASAGQTNRGGTGASTGTTGGAGTSGTTGTTGGAGTSGTTGTTGGAGTTGTTGATGDAGTTGTSGTTGVSGGSSDGGSSGSGNGGSGNGGSGNGGSGGGVVSGGAGGAGGAISPSGGGTAGAGGTTAAPKITLGADASALEVVSGSSVSFGLTLTRGNGATGDVALQFTGLPTGVTADVSKIAAGATTATVKLTATTAAVPGTLASFTVQGTVGTAVSSAKVELFVRGKPGTLDTTYGTAGKSFVPTIHQIQSAALGAGDRVVAAGYTQNQTSSLGRFRGYVVRLDNTGAFDAEFGSSGEQIIAFENPNTVFARFWGVQVLANSIVAFGSTSIASGTEAVVAARFGLDGAPDPTFGGAGKVMLYLSDSSVSCGGDCQLLARAGVVSTDGKLAFAGEFHSQNTRPWGIGRINADGTFDATLGSKGVAFSVGYSGAATCMVRRADGRYVVGGSDPSGTATQWQITQFTSLGVAETTYGPSGGGGRVDASQTAGSSVADCALDSQGNLVAVGGLTDKILIDRFLPSGLSDQTFSPDLIFNGAGLVTTTVADIASYTTIRLAIQADDKPLVLAGKTLLRYTKAGALDTTFGANGSATFTAYTPVDVLIDSRSRALVVSRDSDGTDQGISVLRFWL